MMNKKMIFGLVGAFVSGVVAGGAGVYYYMQRKFDDELNQEVAAVKAHAKKKMAEMETQIEEGAVIVFEDDISEEEEDEYDEIDAEAFQLDPPSPPSLQDRMKNPYIISRQEFDEEMLHFTKEIITYYKGDEIFTDEQEELIPDIRTLIGDAYEYFGCDPDDPDIVHVRNYRLATDFEVAQVYANYYDTVVGSYRGQIDEVVEKDDDDWD